MENPYAAFRHLEPRQATAAATGVLMNDKIRQLLAQIGALEAELLTAMHAQETRMFFEIRGKRVEFQRSVKDAHHRLKRGILRWIVTDRPQNFITGPVIYGMIAPLLLLDLCVTFYQAACFPIYGIAKVRRADYIVIDRQYLGYLNFYERFHCTFCAYANGLITYAGEITARTEQYFCPIKHAHKVLGTHARYARFLDYGDPTDYHKRLEEFRTELARENAREGTGHRGGHTP
jgi:hypothetical protein